jgi:hypothetical protein
MIQEGLINRTTDLVLPMMAFAFRENRVIPITYDPIKKKLKLHTEWETFPTMNFAKQQLLCEKGPNLSLKIIIHYFYKCVDEFPDKNPESQSVLK